MIWHTRPNEPRHTIYVERWREGLGRLRKLEGEQRRLFTELLAHVEAGWRHVRPLQLAYERLTAGEEHSGPIADVLAFVHEDVVDTYRELAIDAANLVPGWAGWEQAADPGDLDGDAGVFMRFLGVLRMASSCPEMSEQLLRRVEDAWTALQGWDVEFTRLLRVIDQTVILPSLVEQDRAGTRPRLPPASEDATAL